MTPTEYFVDQLQKSQKREEEWQDRYFRAVEMLFERKERDELLQAKEETGEAG